MPFRNPVIEDCCLNTIKKSIKLATDNGFTITTHEKDDDDTYQLVIEIPKKQ